MNEIPSRDAVLDQLFARSSLRIALHGIHMVQTPERVIGYEALMRGPRGTPYESPPLAFAMAATLDLLEKLDCRCIELASTVGCDGLLFVNAHPRTIICSDVFWGTVGAFTRDPKDVVFEVVEHSPARQDDLLRALRELRSLGFGIAVDDLGEGSAGLRRLVEFAPDFAKIDRFFIDRIDRDRKRRAVVKGLVEMSHELGTRIIAEGVERAEELEVLRDLGVLLAQGWLFGKPDEVVG
ncbi:MAG: EAL domain-containing protein [Acidobacteriota bacterium]|nr:EAL domain-containing protein [Acidobacteriota bacterium]